jgi:hypothetical protein
MRGKHDPLPSVAADTWPGLGGERGIGFSDDTALEAAQDLGLDLALGGPPGDVVLGGLVAVHAVDGHLVRHSHLTGMCGRPNWT